MLLEWLGKIGKGWATVAGIIATLVTTFVGADAAELVSTLIDNIWNLLMALGALLAFFGIGRKAGANAAKAGEI